ncbi:MAG: DUF3137 domain-containing protein [Elusimicrobiaceae bacterium]|nr:DUF3137 domain-containing protein [Elusimicrobiaceae bacterium]
MVEQNKNTQLQKDIFDLSEAEFIYYFQEKIFSLYCSVKNKKIYQKVADPASCLKSIFFVFISIVLLILLFWFIMTSFTNMSFLIALTSMLFLAFWCRIVARFFISKINIIKKESPISEEAINLHFKKAVFNMLGLSHEDINLGIDMRVLIRFYDIFKQLFGQVNGNIEEIFTGAYHKIPFTMVEQFNGISHDVLLITKTSKSFKGEIQIVSSTRPTLGKGFQPVNLEDVKFSKEYNVYAQDQVEARYLLTPAFLERVKRYRNVKLCDMEIAFSQKYPQFGNVFFHIKTGMDMFELPANNMGSKEARAKAVYNILFEIKDILRIVDTLKLDQDIGM